MYINMNNAGTGMVVALLIFLVTKLWRVFKIALWRPYVLTKFFEKQGVRGPTYFLLYGSLKEMKKLHKVTHEMVLDVNCHDITQKVTPHFYKWSKEYGETFLFWYGTDPRVIVRDPELAKQILYNKFGTIVRQTNFRPTLVTLAGKGLALLEGVDWGRHRSILNPAFSMDKLKAMIERMAACTMSMLDKWKEEASVVEDKCIKKEMTSELQKLTADIIAHTSFGINYLEGMEAFKAQKELQKCCVDSDTDIFIPGSQYLPTSSNIQIWKLDRKVKDSLIRIIESRLRTSRTTSDYGDDLLGLMIEAFESGDAKAIPKLNMEEIIDECKMFFFAGHETTAILLIWTFFLLCTYPEWQDKLRQEVLKECGMRIPNADTLAKLKLVNMVLLEVLRIYCPVIELVREVLEDMKLGNLMIPKGTYVTIPILQIHRSKELWGEDANEFNPLRFVNGVSKAAKHPSAFLAFSMGPKVCIGQNFAMLEAKTVIALALQRFSLSLSPEYKHAPMNFLTLQPQHGLPIIVKPLQQ